MTHIAVVCQDKGIPLDGSKGASIHLRSMVIAFARNGTHVTVFSPRIGDPGWSAGLSIDTIQLAYLSEGLNNSTEIMATALGETNTVRPIDAVYERLSLFASGTSRWAEKADVPHGVEVNAPLAAEAHSYRGLEDFDLASEIEREVLRKAEHLFPVSPWLKRWLIDSGCIEERIQVLPNGIHSDFLTNEPGPKERRDPSKDSFTLGFVGSLKPWHDLETLVEAFTVLPKNEFDLVIVGKGPKREWLEDLSSTQLGGRRLRLREVVPNTEIGKIIDTMDVCVAPYSRIDPFYFCPIKMFEYGARKRPIVIPDLHELREQFPEGSTVNYQPSDAKDLARRIIQVRECSDRTNRYVETMFEFVRNHTWEKHAESVLGSFDRVIRRGSGVE